MSEFTAALGLLQIERLDEIVAWKNQVARTHLDPVNPSRLELPDGMVSGLYKYIVFDWLERLDRPRLRRAVPPDPRTRRRTAQHRLGRAQPFLRPAVLPADQRDSE